MLKIDNQMLVDLGLGDMPDDEKKALLAHIYEQLEINVGKTLASKMSAEQLDEFEAFVDSNDEEGALKWLQANFPNYKDIVADELEKLKKEVKENKETFLAQ
jgi:hypothetical protein